MQETPFNLDKGLDKVDPTAFIANTATVVGDVSLGKHSSVWFSAVMRADLAPIIVGDNCSIQDGAIIHVDDENPTRIGHNVTIGHGAIIHGCEIDDNVLIGIRAVILSGARIGAHCIIGACALVTEGMQVPPHSLVLGVPGRVVKNLTEEHQVYHRHTWEEYVALTQAYKHHRQNLDQVPPPD